ncbi:MAG TPA: hypothetical protein VHX61_08290 [Rhizomicrobium sp.]|jgi:hypothetical protein|nr:hypothetical protein [Rhizomicrobium sp.]
MEYYRVYLLDGSGRIVGVREHQAENDAAVLKIAKQYCAGQGIEVWQRARFVGNLPRMPEPPSPPGTAKR